MCRPQSFHTIVIDHAFENKDRKTVIQAYLDILDYDHAGLKTEHLLKVYESMDYD